MRNGDYTPTRLEAQNDAVTFLFNAKTQSNPENTVGLITMAGKRL
jgi:26S proteasome regulatory subunit N10